MDKIEIIITDQHIDHYDHVGHERYQKLAENAQQEYLSRRDVNFMKIEREYNLRCVQRFFSIEFIKPIFKDNKVIIETQLQTSGRTSFEFYQNIILDSCIVTKIKTVYVLIDKYGKKVSMSEELMEKFISSRCSRLRVESEHD